MNVEHIKEMLELQCHLNSVVNPDWKTAKNPWTRAIWIESGELMEHLGWKWWKAQAPNIAQAHIELVDIWHFILSQFAEVDDDLDAVARELHYRLTDHGRRVAFTKGRIAKMDDLSERDLIDLLAGHAAHGDDCSSTFAAICERLGLSWENLRRTYVAKNVLNLLRQNHGYKSGQYVKEWHGVEDNVHLEMLLANNPGISASDLYIELTHIYSTVQKEAA